MYKSEALQEAQYWFREVEQIVRWTREEATRLGLTLPCNFANSKEWWKAEAGIDKAISTGDYIKTRDLSRRYVVRAVNYCRACLEENTNTAYKQQRRFYERTNYRAG